MSELALYTTSLCPDCWRVRSVLRRIGVPFQEVDILQDIEGGEEMVRLSGQRYIPTLIFPDGSILVEPDNFTLMDRVTVLLE